MGLLYYAEIKHFRGKKSKIAVFLAILIPSILAGVRDYTVGGDISAYGNIWFKNARSATDYIEFIKNANTYSIGYGYATLNFIVSRFTDVAHWLYFFLCLFELITLFLALYRFKDSLRISVAFLIYYLLYYNDSLNNMRQFPAILIILFAFRFVINRKLVLYTISIVFASFFHETAVLAIVIYPLSLLVEGKLKRIYYYLIMGATVAVSVFMEKVFMLVSGFGVINTMRYLHYFSDQDIIGGRFIRIVMYTMIFVYFLLNKKRLLKKENTKYMIGTLFSISTLSLLFTITLFGTISTFIVRVAYYFDFFEIIYLPMLAFRKKNKKIRVKISIDYTLIILLSFIYWLITYAIRNGAHTIPYVFMQN